MADFFSSVFTTEPIGEVPVLEPRRIKAKFEDIVITEESVRKELLKMNPNKSQGPDMIHPKVLKELSHILCKPLTKMFNKSLQDGVVPQSWKLGNINAIFKKGDRSEPGNQLVLQV